MNNNVKPLDIYLMGIGGTGMGAFAGLLKALGHNVRGSDAAVYSPMKEKLAEWGISYQTPYSVKNIQAPPDLVIIGNVIRKDNEEAAYVLANDIPYDSFPSALKKLFLGNADSLVVTGTHGKTTCSSLLAHALFSAGQDPGFLIGGIPENFGESFRVSKKPHYPFVIEGDEYDTAFFDKKAKFFHYAPNLLLVTSLEFDHGDIYRDVDAIIAAFAELFSTLKSTDTIIYNTEEPKLARALLLSSTKASTIGYGEGGRYRLIDFKVAHQGMHLHVECEGKAEELFLPLFGRHNAMNGLGCFAVLHEYGVPPQEIRKAYASFKGARRRLQEIKKSADNVMLDDFAHHPTAVRETVYAARLRYPGKKIVAIFEPRSATSCSKIFQADFQSAFENADEVYFAPLGRNLEPHDALDTEEICSHLRKKGIPAQAFKDYDALEKALKSVFGPTAFLFMSNGDFKGHLKTFANILL